MKIQSVATLVLLASSLLGTAAFAESDQRSQGPRHGMSEPGFRDPTMMLEKMSEHLGLDELQRQQVENVFASAKPEMELLRERMKINSERKRALADDDPNRAAAMTEIATEEGQLRTEGMLLRDRVHTQINAILSDEQRQKMAEGRQRMEQRGQGGKHGGHPSKGDRDAGEPAADIETL